MQHAFWIRNGTEHEPGAVVELAVAAEEAGWDGVFVSDAVQEGYTEPWTLLAAIAARTQRLTLGTWVTPLVARDVVGVARAVANVDQLSQGRVLVGLGLGNQVEHDALGVPRDALGARYDAALEVLDALLRGEVVTRSDTWFDLTAVQLNVRCVQDPRPPLLLGCNWPAAAPLRRAARWDGTLPFWPGIGEGRDESIAPGTSQRELRELMDVYRDAGGDGVVVLPRLDRLGTAHDQLCDEVGATWLLTLDPLDVDAVRAGPPT